MTNQTNQANLSLTTKVANLIGDAAAWTADSIEGGVTQLGMSSVAAYARAENIVVTLRTAVRRSMNRPRLSRNCVWPHVSHVAASSARN